MAVRPVPAYLKINKTTQSKPYTPYTPRLSSGFGGPTDFTHRSRVTQDSGEAMRSLDAKRDAKQMAMAGTGVFIR